MRLRQKYGIPDRIRLLLILFMVLLVLLGTVLYRNGQKKTGTLEDLLRTAMLPVGTTMYIWGGGWDDADHQAGAGSTRLGLSPEWKTFADAQDETYDFEDYRFQREEGLDCSGYIGWVMYNCFEEKSGQTGYVTSSTDMARDFASRGWGELIENPECFLPGDIVSMEGHVWMSLGTCADGSVLLVHASPPGVAVCGTPAPEKSLGEERLQEESRDDMREIEFSQNQEGKSIAISLAEEFMSTYYPKWQERYPNRGVGEAYLENVAVMRWNSRTMSDAEMLQGMSGEEVLEYLRSCI